jgi:hypothetical protein
MSSKNVTPAAGITYRPVKIGLSDSQRVPPVDPISIVFKELSFGVLG